MRRLLALALLFAAGCGGAPDPARIEAVIAPSRTWYHTGETVMLTGRVFDVFGEPIEDVEVIWSVEPDAAAEAGAPGESPRARAFTLTGEGRVVFTGCVAPTLMDEAPTLCDTVAIRVDDGMPSLEVTSPTPGAELDDAEGIVVTGSVADRGMVNVYVNGAPAEVDALGQFEATLEGFFGVNHLVVTASDGLTDVSEVEMDVLWAPAYTPALDAEGRPSLTLDDGLSLWLGQGFFDDGVPLDRTAEPVVTRDLADIMELALASLDVGGVIPDPVVDDPPTFTLRVTGARLADPQVEIDVTDDGADLFVRLGTLEADTSGLLQVEGTSLPLTGSIRAAGVAFARMTIRKESPDAAIEVTLGDLVVGLESLEGSFVSEETAAVFRLAEGLFRTTLETLLVDALRDTLEDSVPALLQDAFTAIDGALQDQELTLDSPPFPAVTLQIDGRVAALQPTFRSQITLGMRTRVGTDVVSLHPESRGVPRLSDVDRAPPFFGDGSLKVAVRLALLNALLHSLWSSGLLDVDASPILPESLSGLVSEAQILGRLPPVLRPPRPEEEDDLVLTLGQLELALTYQGEPVRYGVTIDAGVNLDVRDNRIAILLDEEPAIRVWTLQPPSNPRALTADTVRTLLLDLWPMLSGSLRDGLSLDVPLPSLGDLGGLAPELADLRLTLAQTERARPRRGVLVIEAELTGTLP